eukprot:381446-Amphidinium_carterae.1
MVAFLYSQRPFLERLGKAFQVVALFGSIAEGAVGAAQICQRDSHFWVFLTVTTFFYSQRPLQVVSHL